MTGSLRQRMEQHRANPACATCHQKMDPLGFGLENFDGIGGWRTTDGKFKKRFGLILWFQAIDLTGIFGRNRSIRACVLG